jgi:hypothetical protein
MTIIRESIDFIVQNLRPIFLTATATVAIEFILGGHNTILERSTERASLERKLLKLGLRSHLPRTSNEFVRMTRMNTG